MASVLRIVQQNFSKSELTANEIQHIAQEEPLDIIVMHEPYCTEDGQVGNFLPPARVITGAAGGRIPLTAIMVLNERLAVEPITSLCSDRCVCARIDTELGVLFLVSLYSPLSEKIDDCLTTLHELELYLAEQRMLVCVDANAKSIWWSNAESTDERGERLEDAILRNNWCVLNRKDTLGRTYDGRSHSDLTLATKDVLDGLERWEALRDWTSSPRRTIWMEVYFEHTFFDAYASGSDGEYHRYLADQEGDLGSVAPGFSPDRGETSKASAYHPGVLKERQTMTPRHLLLRDLQEIENASASRLNENPAKDAGETKGDGSKEEKVTRLRDSMIIEQENREKAAADRLNGNPVVSAGRASTIYAADGRKLGGTRRYYRVGDGGKKEEVVRMRDLMIMEQEDLENAIANSLKVEMERAKAVFAGSGRSRTFHPGLGSDKNNVRVRFSVDGGEKENVDPRGPREEAVEGSSVAPGEQPFDLEEKKVERPWLDDPHLKLLRKQVCREKRLMLRSRDRITFAHTEFHYANLRRVYLRKARLAKLMYLKRLERMEELERRKRMASEGDVGYDRFVIAKISCEGSTTSWREQIVVNIGAIERPKDGSEGSEKSSKDNNNIKQQC